MLPLEFFLTGPPVSHQTHNRRRLHEWQDRVREAARLRIPTGAEPVAVPCQVTVIYFHDERPMRIDNDNLAKPVLDALNGLVFADDRLVTHTIIRRVLISEHLLVRNSDILGAAFATSAEFVYVRVELAPAYEEVP
jgi:crossover junction endodeoxyribonuclease RusA